MMPVAPAMDFMILKVNGTDMSDASHQQIVEAFYAAKEPITVEVSRRAGSKPSTPTKDAPVTDSTPRLVSVGTQTVESEFSRIFSFPSPPPITMSVEDVRSLAAELEYETDLLEDIQYEEVVLHRSSHHDRIGLTLGYGPEAQDGVTDIFIEEVEFDSIAGKDGRLQQGDQLLQINNVDVRNREQAIHLFSQLKSDISLLVCRPNTIDQDDGFIEQYTESCQDYSLLRHLQERQYLQEMPLIEEEKSCDDCSTITDTATLPSQKEKEGKDSGVGHDSAPNDDSSEQEFDVTRPVERAASLSDEGSTFRKLLESRCPEESNLHRTVPRMGTRLMQHGSGDNSLNRSVKGESEHSPDTAYNTADSSPDTLRTKQPEPGNLPGPQQTRERKKKSKKTMTKSVSAPTITNNNNVTENTEEELAQKMVEQQNVLLQQTAHTTDAEETSAADANNMEWVVKRRSDGTRYIMKRPRKVMLNQRKQKLEIERCGMTTDDDAMSELKVGRYWSKEDRRRHLQKSKAYHRQKEMMRHRIDTMRKEASIDQSRLVQLSHKKQHRHAVRDLDFVTVPELLAHGGANHVISVTTV